MNELTFSLDLRGLADGTDGLEDVLVNLFGLGFGFDKVGKVDAVYPVYPSVNKIPENWTMESYDNGLSGPKAFFQIDVKDDKGNLRIHREPGKTTLCTRFKLLQRKSNLLLLDEELGDGYTAMRAAEFPITLRFYNANRVEVDAIIDTHLPNIRNPFDHWGQDRTRAIQSMQKELGILVQSTPEKITFKKKITSVEP